jgi:hypothetical protein
VLAVTPDTVEIWDGKTFIDPTHIDIGKSTEILTIPGHDFVPGNKATLVLMKVVQHASPEDPAATPV